MELNTFVELGTIAKYVFGALGIGFMVGFVAGAYAFLKNEEIVKRRDKNGKR